MSSNIPPQLHQDQPLDLEGPGRRLAFITGKEIVKSQVHCRHAFIAGKGLDKGTARIGDNDFCSRSTKGIYDIGGDKSNGVNHDFRKVFGADADIYNVADGKAHGDGYDAAVGKARKDISDNAYGKAYVANGKAIELKAGGKATKGASLHCDFAAEDIALVVPPDIGFVKDNPKVIDIDYGGAAKEDIILEVLDVVRQDNVIQAGDKAEDAISQSSRESPPKDPMYKQAEDTSDNGPCTRTGKVENTTFRRINQELDNFALSEDDEQSIVINDCDGFICMITNNGILNKGTVKQNYEWDEFIAGNSFNNDPGIDNLEVNKPGSLKNARNIVVQAGVLYTTIAKVIKDANDKLIRMEEPNVCISQDVVVDLQNALVDNVSVLFEGIVACENSLMELRQNLKETRMENSRLREELENADSALKQLQGKSVGLSKNVQKQLKLLGVEKVEELILKYMTLQTRVEVVEKHISAQSVCSKISRAGSTLSVAERYPKTQPQLSLNNKILPPSNRGLDVPSSGVNLPMPDKFYGKTSADLKRFFSLYEVGTNSKGWNDEQRAIYLGSYLPKLQLYHDSLRERKATYQEMKKELLDALGSEGVVANFCLRGQLDRLTKAPGKAYKQFFEETELKVIEAYGGDTVKREDELKKILLRITEEDQDHVYRTVAITNATASYFKLKELVLAMESSQQLKKKPEAKKSDFSYKAFRDNEERKEARRGNHQDFQGEKHESVWEEHSDSEEPYDNFEQKERSGEESSDSEGSSQKFIRCYNARDCPEGEYGNAHSVKLEEVKICIPAIYPVQKVDVKGEALFGKPALLEVLFDGIKVNTLLDSGATSSVVRDTVVGTILCMKERCGHNIVEVPREEYVNKRLTGADGRPLKVINCIKIPIAWGTIPNKFAKFFVVQGLQQDAIIGTNVLEGDLHWIEAICFALDSQGNELKHVGALGTAQQSVYDKVLEDKIGRQKKVKASRQFKGNGGERKEFVSKGTVKTQGANLSPGDINKAKTGCEKAKVEAKGEDAHAKADVQKSCEGDTVVIGGTNAYHLARAIGAQYWNTKALNNNGFYSKVIAGNYKRLIYFPSGDIFFHRGLEFNEARDLLLKSLKQLSKLDAVEVIVLPVFRDFKFMNVSQKFISWYNNYAKVDARFQQQETDIFKWMEANVRDKSLQYVKAQGIVTEDGMKRLCEYLNHRGYNFKVRDSMKRNQDASHQRSQSSSNGFIGGTNQSNHGCHPNVSIVCRTWFNSNDPSSKMVFKSAWSSMSVLPKCSKDAYARRDNRDHQPRGQRKNQTYVNKRGRLFEGGGAREARAIFNGTGAADFWFGANHINGNWEWIDGSYRKFANWNKLDQTNQPYTICGALDLGETSLNGGNCFNFKPYVCEFIVNKEMTTTSSTESTPTSSSTESTSTSLFTESTPTSSSIESTSTSSSTESTPTSSSTESTPTSSSTESSSTSYSTESTSTSSSTETTPTTTTSATTESTSTSSATDQPTTPTASTPQPTITSSCSGFAKNFQTGCSDECEQSCGERLIKRAQRVCSRTFSFRKNHASLYCDDQTLYQMCCLKECSDCDIKACRCPELLKEELETK